MIESKALKKYSLFGGLDNTQLGYVYKMLKEEDYAPGEKILKEGEVNSKVFFIQNGDVRIDKFKCPEAGEKKGECEITHIADLHTGDTFGEMELIDIQPCAATVTAATEVHLLTLSNVDLHNLEKLDLKAFTLMIMNLAREISRRLRVMDSKFSGFIDGRQHMKHQQQKGEN